MTAASTSRTVFSVFLSLFMVGAAVADANAQGRGGGGRGGGGRGGGGGYSRSGPAAGGGFAAQRPPPSGGRVSAQRPAGGTGGSLGGGTAARQAGATERSGQRMAASQTNARQAGATERSGQRAQTQQTRAEERTERQGQRQGGMTERTDARQQGQTERTQARANAAQNISGNWDGYRYYDDHDDDWGYALAGAAIGATAGYIAGAATAAPTYVTVLPCSPSMVTASGVSYYGCGGTWYNRTYVNGAVSYVVVPAPPGY